MIIISDFINLELSRGLKSNESALFSLRNMFILGSYKLHVYEEVIHCLSPEFRE